MTVLFCLDYFLVFGNKISLFQVHQWHLYSLDGVKMLNAKTF